MSEEIKDPQGEIPITPPVTEPQVEPPVEEWDKERAAATIKAQRDENKAPTARAKRADELEAEAQKRADAELSETERLKKENEEIRAENARTKNTLMRNEAVLAAGLPVDFAKRLTGETAEELLADANELAKTMPQLRVAPKVPPTNPANAATVDSETEVRKKLWPQASRLDINTIERLGGGVVWNEKKLTKE